MDTCIDCGNQISMRCMACPKCGRRYPVGKIQQEKWPNYGFIRYALPAAFIITPLIPLVFWFFYSE
ncbi:MAG: hypothetical protein ACR2OA_04245 [Rubripirellula sp.]